jgi:hypothetical protein
MSAESITVTVLQGRASITQHNSGLPRAILVQGTFATHYLSALQGMSAARRSPGRLAAHGEEPADGNGMVSAVREEHEFLSPAEPRQPVRGDGPHRIQTRRKYSMTSKEVLKLIGDKEVQFIDLRFTDTKGKEQHVTLPASKADEDLFEEGKMFDGSSIAGWKTIHESDMVLMPDTSTAVIDPFSEDTTLNITCDVYEPSTMQGYERDPRSLARRAEAYLKSTGVADVAYFGPENEFFIFDDVRWSSEMKGVSYQVDSSEAGWNSEKIYPDRCRPWIRCTTSAPRCAWCLRTSASTRKSTTTRWPRPASAKSAWHSIRSSRRPTRSRN